MARDHKTALMRVEAQDVRCVIMGFHKGLLRISDINVGSGDVVKAISGVLAAVCAGVIGTQMCDCQFAAVGVRAMSGITLLHGPPH